MIFLCPNIDKLGVEDILGHNPVLISWTSFRRYASPLSCLLRTVRTANEPAAQARWSGPSLINSRVSCTGFAGLAGLAGLSCGLRTVDCSMVGGGVVMASAYVFRGLRASGAGRREVVEIDGIEGFVLL